MTAPRLRGSVTPSSATSSGADVDSSATARRSASSRYAYGGTCSAIPWCSRPPVRRSSSPREISSSASPRLLASADRLGHALVRFDADRDVQRGRRDLRAQRFRDRIPADEQLRTVLGFALACLCRAASADAVPAATPGDPCAPRPAASGPCPAALACSARRSRPGRPSSACGSRPDASNCRPLLQIPSRSGGGVLDDDTCGGELVANRVRCCVVLACRAPPRAARARRRRARRRSSSGRTPTCRPSRAGREPSIPVIASTAPSASRTASVARPSASAVFPSRTRVVHRGERPGHTEVVVQRCRELRRHLGVARIGQLERSLDEVLDAPVRDARLVQRRLGELDHRAVVRGTEVVPQFDRTVALHHLAHLQACCPATSTSSRRPS